MKKLYFAVLGSVFLLAAENVGAQAASSRIDWNEELNLSDEQKSQVKAIYAQSHEQVVSISKQIQALHKEIANIQESDDAKIRALLTAKQQVKFDKIKLRQNKGKQEATADNKDKKPSRKRMRQYGTYQN